MHSLRDRVQCQRPLPRQDRWRKATTIQGRSLDVGLGTILPRGPEPKSVSSQYLEKKATHDRRMAKPGFPCESFPNVSRSHGPRNSARRFRKVNQASNACTLRMRVKVLVKFWLETLLNLMPSWHFRRQWLADSRLPASAHAMPL